MEREKKAADDVERGIGPPNAGEDEQMRVAKKTKLGQMVTDMGFVFGPAG